MCILRGWYVCRKKRETKDFSCHFDSVQQPHSDLIRPLFSRAVSVFCKSSHWRYEYPLPFFNSQTYISSCPWPINHVCAWFFNFWLLRQIFVFLQGLACYSRALAGTMAAERPKALKITVVNCKHCENPFFSPPEAQMTEQCVLSTSFTKLFSPFFYGTVSQCASGSSHL